MRRVAVEFTSLSSKEVINPQKKNPLKVQETLLSAALFPSSHFTFHFTGFML